MGKVCVVTGGGSGMGLAAAKFMPKDAEYAASLGTITNVIHAAGVSPAMKGTMENILRNQCAGNGLCESGIFPKDE